MISYLLRSSIFGIVALLAFTFIPAGTFHYWQGWAYVVTWIIVGSTYTVYVATHDPALLRRRTEAGISHEKEPTQKVIIFFLFVAFIALITLPPLDHRFGWSPVVPAYLFILGDALGALGILVYFFVVKANRYASRRYK